MNQYNLQENVAIVTGSARGIGFAVAERMIKSGAKVAIWDIDADKAVESATELGNEHALAVSVDLTDADKVSAAVDTTLDHFGRIDVLVNNAGITGPTVPLADYSVKDWYRVIEVDLFSVFNCCHAVVPVMKQSGYGRIVNVSSVAGKEGNPNMSAYSSAKGAVIALTKSLAKELTDQDIRVNCITPATVKTEIFSQMSEEQIQYMLSKIPLGRFGTAEENASLITWLCTSECSFSTGGVFDTSGGRCTY